MVLETKRKFDELVRVSRELSSGKPLPQLFKGVIEIVCKATNAEGGTIYIHDNKQDTLKAVLLANFPLGMQSVVDEFDPLSVSGFIEVPLLHGAGEGKISAASFLQQRTIVVSDVSNNDEFDFSGVQAFDEQNNYTTRSMIALPLNDNRTTIGVLQLINPTEEFFEKDNLEFLEILCGQIAIALNNALLIKEGENLLSAIVQMVGMAIDEKSPHTAGHCRRVTELTMMLTDAAAQETDGPLANYNPNEIEREELRMAALLHDVGKVITPTHILEKHTKLYSLTDRIELLTDRFHMWTVSAELEALKKAVVEAGREDLLSVIEDASRPSKEDMDFLDSINKGLVPMTPENVERLNKISNLTITMSQKTQLSEKVIQDDDLSNLQTFRGTLNPEERLIMENHVNSSIRLLSSIPWPNKFARLVEYAAHHHEKMDGTGYPNKVSAKDLSIPARILGIADRFEGLSAPDRPYRTKKMTLSQAIKIMTYMSEDGEIDPILFEVFMRNKIYMEYGRKYLDDSLIDCE